MRKKLNTIYEKHNILTIKYNKRDFDHNEYSFFIGVSIKIGFETQKKYENQQ